MPGGGSLHDTWDTRGELPVKRPACCVPGCPERPTYPDDNTDEPICGPHLRARRRERDSSPPSSLPASHPPESPMPAKCARPSCTNPNHAHGLCASCRSRAKSRGLSLNRRLTTEELALLDVKPSEAKRARAEAPKGSSTPKPAKARAIPTALAATPPNALRRQPDAERDEGCDGILEESIEACKLLGIDITGDYDYLGTLQELVEERAAIRAIVLIPGAESAVGPSLAANVGAMAKQLQDEIERAARLAELRARAERAESIVTSQRAMIEALAAESQTLTTELAAARAPKREIKPVSPERRRAILEVFQDATYGSDYRPTAADIAEFAERLALVPEPIRHLSATSIARLVSDLAAEGWLVGDGKKPRGYTLSEAGRAELGQAGDERRAGVA